MVKRDLNNLMWIKTPDGIHNNYGIEIYHDNPDLVESFAVHCYECFPSNKFGTFHQGGHNDPKWNYFEFWKGADKQDEILHLAMCIAETLGVELDII